MFKLLVAYKDENGDCAVPSGYPDKQLGWWVRNQRGFYRKGTLDTKYVERLEKIGFVWSLRGAGTK